MRARSRRRIPSVSTDSGKDSPGPHVRPESAHIAGGTCQDRMLYGCFVVTSLFNTS